ncbi:hypothetical protein FDR03_17825 [Salmonella enterica]|nr:hypothetical protein [Salmonella enterica]
MKAGVIRNKHAENFRKICLLFIRLTINVLKLFPFAMVIGPVVWFYFCPEYIISDIVNNWQDADTLEKILLVKLYLKTVLILTVVSVVVLYLSSGKFMSVKRGK